MPPSTVPASTPLHEAARALGGLSLITYNVLLPNSGTGGWWVFKYYDASVPDEARTWAHRQALLRSQLLGARADIVCLQETCADTFAGDLGFLTEAGYGARIHRKYNLRPATFFRTDRLSFVAEHHTDKALTLLLRPHAAPQTLVAVVNVHLAAAPDPRRRFRQVFDALDRLRKDLVKRKVSPERAAVIVCGDFNASPEGTGTDALLRGQTIGPGFREPRYPDAQLSSKPRKHAFTPFSDLYRDALGEAPVTLLGGRLSAYTPTADGLPPALLAAIDAMFDRFAEGGEVMDWPAVEAWVKTINRDAGRGSELRKAQAIVAERAEKHLSRDEFQALYRSELSEGKYWSVQHDLQTCGVVTDTERGLYAASLDRIYHTGALTPLALWSPLTEAQQRELAEQRLGLPNAWHPSDHLPLGCVLGLPGEG